MLCAQLYKRLIDPFRHHSRLNTETPAQLSTSMQAHLDGVSRSQDGFKLITRLKMILNSWSSVSTFQGPGLLTCTTIGLIHTPTPPPFFLWDKIFWLCSPRCPGTQRYTCSALTDLTSAGIKVEGYHIQWISSFFWRKQTKTKQKTRNIKIP